MDDKQLRYEKLADDLAGMIRSGVLAQGDRLPSVRRLAGERRLSATTVVQAMRQLESAGLIEARPQSGFFVRRIADVHAQPRGQATPDLPMPVDISQQLLRVLTTCARPTVAPLGAALPANALLPLNALQRLYSGVARRHPHLLEAGSHVNMDSPQLIRQLVRRSLSWGGPLAAGEFVITNSCTEALSLCLRAVTRQGDTVAVESPAYYLMLQLLESLGLKALEIPTDPGSGMSVEALELATRHGGIAACLLVANGSNPSGSVMPDDKKAALAALTAARAIPVIEDDIYGDLHLEDQRPWPVKAFDRSGNVMLCASFSKCLSPSLRIGFVAAGKYRAEIALQKTVTSGATNPVTQQVLAEYLESGAFERHLRGLRREYRQQLSAMQVAVGRYFPAGTRISRPKAGFVLWIELPEHIDTLALYESAIERQVAYVPGPLFSPSGMYRNCLRLNCGNPHTAQIDEAIRRLGEIFGGSAKDSP